MGSKESKIRLLGLLAALFVLLPVSAWNYNSQETTTTQSAQIRVGADFHKKWNNGLRLSLGEELRFDAYHSVHGASFNRSYTTLIFGYAPIQYVRFDVGYTLKIHGPNSTWSEAKKADPNEWIRHRVFFGVTGSLHTRYAKLSLRERALMEARTDSVNPLEKNQYNWQLRSRVAAEFIVPGKPAKPYVWVEVINTLNAPEYQQKNGHQFISDVRAQTGVKWRLTKMSSLDFYYRFTYGYDRDINITKTMHYIELTETTHFQHAIGVTYNLDW